MSFKINPLSAVDSYKLSHRPAYPKGTEFVYSNFTPRSVKHLNVPEEYKTNEIVWFGGQAIIQELVEMWDEEFFRKEISSYHQIIEKFTNLIAPFAGADYATEHLRELYNLGYLPLRIKTLPEGARVPVGVPVLTIENTDKRFFWLTNYIETYLSTELWKPSTSATIADVYRRIGTKWYEKTGASMDFLDFAFHDFSFRGMSGSIDAAKSGAGHLLSFKGTDTIPAVEYLNYYYNTDGEFVGASVPAMEHSVQTAYQNNDLEYFRNIVTKVYPKGIVSVVADGYDYWNVLTGVLPKLKEDILARPVNELGMSKVVIRPDSGDPVRIIAGYNDEEVNYIDATDSWINLYDMETLTHEEVKGSIEVLWDLFGGTINEKGYKVLNPRIGLIYGDSITPQRADEILKRLEEKGFSADNVVFGVGSYTYQYNTRDTLGFAMKATNITINGKDIPLWKDPKTDDGTKKSAKGLLRVRINTEGKYYVLNDQTREHEQIGELTVLFEDGEFHKSESLKEIRNRVANN